MMKHLFLVSLLSLSASASAVELEGTRAPAKTECPSPEEARKKMTVPDGYAVRCFAHEPMIVNPVAMTWDARGRLWVVEGYEYPNGSEFKNEAFGGEAKDDKYHAVPAICQAKDNPLNAMRADHPKIPKDRIIILEDTDNDGVADKRTVFLEGLDMGSAILCGDGGVYVGQQPHLLHFKDTDGDDHADEWRVVLTGFGREDTHELLNSFCWGPDGWLYMTHGVFTNSKVRRPGVPEKEGFKFDAGIGRCRPVKQTLLSASSQPKEEQTGVSVSPWEFEVFADGTSNPWGCDYDERGNFFVSACVIDHFFHMAPGGIYVRQGGAPENPYAYELLPSIVTHKHFRAAYAGVQIYQGGVYPKDTWGHAFIGNIHDNAIHEEILTPVGSTFKCEPRRDFLRANDGWFRPVSTRTGPDGNLWVMDWCDKYPCYQNAKANPEGVDRTKGRIWRVVTVPPKGKPTAEAAQSSLDRLKSATERLKSATDKVKSATDKVLSATDKVKSVTDKGLSATDKVKSATDKGLSATDKVKSATDKGLSATDKVKSATDKGLSATEKVKSATDKGLSATEKVTSQAEAVASLREAIASVTEAVKFASQQTPSHPGKAAAEGEMLDGNAVIDSAEFEGFINYGSPINLSTTDALGNPTTIVLTESRIQNPVFSTRPAAATAPSSPEKAKKLPAELKELNAQAKALHEKVQALMAQLKTPAIALHPNKDGTRSDTDHPAVAAETVTPAALPDHSRPEKTLDLSKLDTPALVKLLGHSNNWMRRMARRELVERQKVTETATAIDKLPPSVSLATKLESLFTLHGIGAVDGKLLDKLAANDDAAIRAWAARLMGEIWRAPLMQGKPPASLYEFKISCDSFERARYRLGHLATDPTLEVRVAVATALRQWSAGCLTVDRPTLVATDLKAGVPIIEGIFALVAADERREGGPPPTDVFNIADWPPAKIIKRAKGDASLAFALWQAIEPIVIKRGGSRTVMMPDHPLTDNLAVQLAVGKSFRRACDGGDVKWIERELESVSRSSDTDFILRCLEGLEKGQESGVLKPTKPFSALFAEFAKSENAEVRKHAQNIATLWGDPEAVRAVAASLLDAKTGESQRLATVQTLRKIQSDEVRAAFAKVLADAANQPPALLMEVIRAAADLGGEGFKDSLAGLASSKNPGVRLAALGALTSRSDWTHSLLDAIQANKISAGGFPVSIRRQLATHADKAISDHAFKALGAWQETDENLKAVIAAKRKACLEGEPDLAAGKLVFQTTCMVCHTFFGGGQKVGPELIGSGRSNLDAILANVIDPNQIIGNGYEGFIVTTTDNQTLMGRITEDTPSHVKLLAIGGAEQTLERSKIAKLENTHRSLMPVGFGGLPDDQFRNLIWYVLAPPDEGPLTPEKKKLLSTSFDAPANKPKVDKNHAIDWESISLWNPQWKVVAPEFDRTPVKLGEYYGKSNVLLLHPFPDKKTPTVLERKLSVSKAKPMLKFAVAADDRGDWELVVTVDGKAVKKQPVDHEKPRWKEVSVDLSEHAGKEVTVRLEGHPTGWSYEFSYWSDIRMD